MTHFMEMLHQYGYVLIFAGVFLEAVGVPVPAAVILVAAGAMSAVGWFKIYWVLPLAIVAMVAGDTIMFILGRKTGWFILKVICAVSMNPETCIVKSANTFYQRGKMTLVIAKFIPGVNTISPPLAGSLKMKTLQFLWFDFLGTLLYITVYTMLGFFFSEWLGKIGRSLATAERVVLWVITAAVLVYVAYRVRTYLKNRMYSAVPYVTVHELRKKVEELQDKIVIYDVRSHGYYESNSKRIPGSLRLEPASIERSLESLPRDKQIYVYCT